MPTFKDCTGILHYFKKNYKRMTLRQGVRLNRVGGWVVGRWVVGHVCLKIKKYYISSLRARSKFVLGLVCFENFQSLI